MICKQKVILSNKRTQIKRWQYLFLSQIVKAFCFIFSEQSIWWINPHESNRIYVRYYAILFTFEWLCPVRTTSSYVCVICLSTIARAKPLNWPYSSQLLCLQLVACAFPFRAWTNWNSIIISYKLYYKCWWLFCY